MADILEFPGLYFGPEDPDAVLEKQKGHLKDCLIIGMNKDGSFHFAGSFSDIPTIIFYLELAKKQMLEDL